jgi:DNA repair exonuclease SbcCD ATPase subunit
MEEANFFVVEYDDNDDSCSWGAAAAAECKAIKGKTLSCSNTALPRPAAAIYEDHAAAVVDHHHHHHHNHHDVDQLLQLLHGSDPVRMELARLENELKDMERELVEAQDEIKALKVSERMKEKAVEELAEELEKVDKKLKAMEILLDNKNLEVKRINDEKKAALAAQIAAEATVRRVQLAAAQKDEDQLLPWSIDAIVAPLESELKLARQEIARLQENNKALERLTKSKEAALVEAGRTVEVAEAKAATIDDLQNQNQELLRKIEIYQVHTRICLQTS